MAIDVGDAVFTFLADTTQLDKAYAQVNAGTETAIKPATTAITGMSAALDESEIAASIATEQYTAAGRAALKMGEEGAAAGEEMAFSMREAKGELALLGEQTGVQIPRHIRSFVAELPGVGKALNAAFEATAVLFIVQILAEGAQKLTEWIADTYIWTEANKENYKSQVELNKSIDEQVKKLEGLKAAYEFIGLEGSAKTGLGLQQLTAEITNNERALAEAKDTIYLYNQGYIAMSAAVLAANNTVAAFPSLIAAQHQQALNLLKFYDEQVLTESIAHKNALIEARKTTEEALANLQLQANKARLTKENANYSDLLAAQEAFDTKIQQLERDALTAKLAELQRDPTKNLNAIVALNAQIQALDTNHQAKLWENYKTFLDKYKAAQKDIVTTTSDTFQLIENIAGEKLDKIKQDFADLGITGVVPLSEKLELQKKAYEDLAKSGLASVLDLKLAWIQYKTTMLDLHRAQGDDVRQEEQDLQKLIASYNALSGVVDKLHIKNFDLFKMWHTEIPKASAAWKDMLQLGKFGLDQFAVAAEAAFASAILSESSFGDALRKGTAQVLAEIAARSLVYAVFYTALGFARLAEYDFVGAGQAFTAAGIYGGVGAIAGAAAYLINPKSDNASSSSGSTTIAAPQGVDNSAPQQTLVTVQNVPKFGSGGLVNGPTVALMGERNSSSREAAIPLDDPEAVSAITDALGGRKGTTIHVHVEGLISPDNLTKVIRHIDRNVNSGRARLTSSNSLRLTKKA